MTERSQKFSKVYSTGFVPNYRHAAETIGESEGLGSSAHADSEDSCTPKRKCISSIIVDKNNGFKVPSQIISPSNMSTSERLNLAKKFRRELEQVQQLQKKVLLLGVSNGVLSSSTTGDEHRLMTSSHISSQLKRGVSGRFESAKDTPLVNPSGSYNVVLMKQCEALLKRLLEHKNGWAFSEPVDPIKLNIPDYFTIIEKPMDLGTIKEKLGSGAYSSPVDFASDVRLTFTNAKTYNPPANAFHAMAETISKFFELRWKNIEKKLVEPDLVTPVAIETSKPTHKSKKRKITPVVPVVPTEVKDEVKRIMTAGDRVYLLQMIESFQGDPPENIQEFLRSHIDNQTCDEEIEIDLASLSDDVLFQLRKLLDDHIKELKSIDKEEDCQVLNVSGLSNFSSHPCEANEPAEEDVDIGGNDPPITSYLPVEIEKDTRNNKCSSSSSSSSGSSSSTSDSDSTSSSESESQIAKDRAPTSAVKDPVKLDVVMDQEKSDLMNPNDTNNQSEQDAQSRVFIEDTKQEEGENTPSKRQVSQEKLTRMALLKSRFADTILKAREKTFDKDEKGDPEKLRQEREELERQKREEKARIQAEAKAAEETHRQAQAAAVADAKRKRELEREAARQALLKIEKTVEINENSQFLKDLEMLRTVPVEQLPSSVDETSPDQTQDGMGGFQLGISNPLEQLGLYMKDDGEDDDEMVPGSISQIQNTVDEEDIDL